MELGSILTPEQVDHYNEHGYVLAKSLFTPEEAAHLRAETHALAERLMERKNIDATCIHFDEASEEKGCVCVVPGSHKLGPLHHEGSYHLPFDEYPLEDSVACPAEAGDVLFFSYLTIHGSGINVSKEARTTLLVQMRDPADDQDARIARPVHDAAPN